MTNDSSGVRVMVSGGGIGGLALAAGLRARGAEVVVFERDDDLTRTGGYHLHLDRSAMAALQSLLPPLSFEQVLASSATTRTQGGDVMRDMRGRLLLRRRAADEDGGVNIDRITLRLILADAVGDALRTGTALVEHTVREGGEVRARLHDGSTESGELLVAADGVHSATAAALAGGPTSTPTGLLGIGGRTPLSALGERAKSLYAGESGLAIGPSGTGLYIGYHDPVGRAAVRVPPVSAPRTAEATYIWGAVISESPATSGLRALEGAELLEATLSLLARAGWTRPMTDVVSASETEGLATFRFHAGSPQVNDLAPWPAGPVTALGDAVHAMPPTAGMGAATAIHDAADLATAFDEVAAGRVTLATAVHGFENRMRRRGAAAIRASLGPVGIIHATNTPVGRIAARVGLPLGAGLARLRPAGR